MKNIFRFIVLILVISLNVGCDQLSKEIAREQLDYGQRISVMGDFASLILVENTGAFLSLGRNLGEVSRMVLLIALPVAMLLFVMVYAVRSRRLTKTGIIAVGCIVGGGIGNLIDRMLYGSVTDFMHMDFYLFQTGIFNVADMSIMTGVGMLMADVLFRKDAHVKSNDL
jgi:signal peptidase II